MFDFLKPKRSPVSQRLQALLVVHRSWFEWTMEGGKKGMTLVVEVTFETEPASPSFYPDGLDQVWSAIEAVEEGEDISSLSVRVIPRKYER